MRYKNNDLYILLKNKLKKYIEILSEKNNRKILMISTMLVLLILMFELVNVFVYQPNWIISEDGKKVGVQRSDGNKNLPMMVEVKNKSGVKSYPIDIKVSGNKNFKNKENNNSKAARNKRQDKDFDKEEHLRIDLGIRRELKNEDRKNKKIYMFPKQLQDGDRLIWSVDKKEMIPKALFLFPIIPVGIVVYSESEKRKREIHRINSIRWSIPSFTHQVVLYMNSGLITSDIMTKLFVRYSESDKRNYLEEMVISACKNSEIMHMESIAVLQKYADESSVSEFMRIIAIISDGQIKGVDIRNKLENESKILWHDRKKTAEERGHIAESKLAVPLSILLLVLMLITAAPAMMEL
ncbi:MAG: hypothetical protein SPH92_02810 [Anaerovoracaceae bacterium]|nr:hypothetical protein [Anaerovoracaceae bacterium]